jgi:hypothetical protein
MYIIDVRPVFDNLPRIFAVNFEPHPSYLGATDIALTLAPESDAEKAFQLLPEYIREGRRGQIHEIESSEIDWGPDLGQIAEWASFQRCPHGSKRNWIGILASTPREGVPLGWRGSLHGDGSKSFDIGR